MVSYDLEYVLTNNPLDESINLAVEYFVAGQSGLMLNSNIVRHLVILATLFLSWIVL